MFLQSVQGLHPLCRDFREIQIQAKESFLNSGGENFDTIPV